ncbi:hypothetical protein [Nannocystis radixulma]|uniref:Uncharacterized protein n=1 Tax=Nannocystis radixulma TaxID=2995305 RepID=A0ABT5AYK6_9BACT|nr:hypothetical protein [Nannocystis radixulma]MDC0666359.1 hypothetical protein [Nannocystis radixulma]
MADELVEGRLRGHDQHERLGLDVHRDRLEPAHERVELGERAPRGDGDSRPEDRPARDRRGHECHVRRGAHAGDSRRGAAIGAFADEHAFVRRHAGSGRDGRECLGIVAHVRDPQLRLGKEAAEAALVERLVDSIAVASVRQHALADVVQRSESREHPRQDDEIQGSVGLAPNGRQRLTYVEEYHDHWTSLVQRNHRRNAFAAQLFIRSARISTAGAAARRVRSTRVTGMTDAFH